MDSLSRISATAASGMRAQGDRLRIVSENLANASSTAGVLRDDADFTLRYEPSHPAADQNGYIKMPNVNPLIEMSNMREAARSYEANLSMLDKARDMRRQLVELLK
jgi:flagellar basal-body rod protein FlgC